MSEYGPEFCKEDPILNGFYFELDEAGVLHLTPERGNALITHCCFSVPVIVHPPVTLVPDTVPGRWT